MPTQSTPQALGCPQDSFPESLCFSHVGKGSALDEGASPERPSLGVSLFCNVKHLFVLLALKPSSGGQQGAHSFLLSQ